MRIVKKSRKPAASRKNHRRKVVKSLAIERLDDRLVLSGASPVATNDVYTLTIDTPLSISGPGVLANDTDPEGDPLKACIFSAPAHGTLTLEGNGSFNYTPN